MVREIAPLLFVIVVTTCDAQQAPTAEQRAEMQRQLQLVGPGEEHENLKKLGGDWSVSMLQGDNDLRFNGNAKARMILGDRFLVIDGQGKPAGRDSGFRYTLGFDRRHDEYVIQCLDTSGTYPVTARGKAGEKGIRMTGTDDDPMMKKMGYGVKKFAFDLIVVDDNEFVIETIYVDTRRTPEVFRPAFRYVFKRQ